MTNTTLSFSRMKRNLRNLLAGLAFVSLSFSIVSVRAASLDLLAGFEGVYSSWLPADPVIAAGPSSLVTMVSGRIAIFNKQGTKLFEQNLGAGGFWAAQGGDQVAEPWVIFDPNSGRFIASAAEFGANKGFLYLAVSKNSQPSTSADWHKYSLDRSGTHQDPGALGVPTYPDDAKVGVDGDALYFSSIHFAKDGSTGLFSHAEIFALAKAPLLSGGPLSLVYDEPVITDSYSPWLVFKIHPAIVFEPAPTMYFVQSLVTRPDNQIVVHAISDVLTAPVRTVSLVPVAPFDRPPDVPQRGSSTLLENGNARLMSAVVRNGSLWTSHGVLDPAVDAESLVRWYQIDITGLPTTAATLVQSGNVDPGSGVHAWLPAVSVDVDGNMGLSFSVGGANQYAAIGYTGRLANDPAGTTLPIHVARAGAGPYTQGGWGEYSGLAIDPDGYTFWLLNEYATKQKTWRTFVAAFEVAPPAPPSGPLHCGDLDGTGVTQSGQKWRATVTVTMHDGDENVVAGATVSAQWSTGAVAAATTDANGRCIFTLSNLSKQTTPSVTLTLTGATHATLSYFAPANHDPDGGSNGTSITVNKP
jgi:hypothetical protein